MIIDVLLAVAVLAAIAGTLTRNWTAGALLASFIVSMILCRIGAEFNLVLWVGIDLMVIAFVARRHMPRTDWLVIGLFVPVWALYIWWPQWGAQAIAVIVAVQMFLTFPAEWVRYAKREIGRFNRTWNPWEGMDLRARLGVA